MCSLDEFALYLLGLFLQTECWYENPGGPWEHASSFLQDFEGGTGGAVVPAWAHQEQLCCAAMRLIRMEGMGTVYACDGK